MFSLFILIALAISTCATSKLTRNVVKYSHNRSYSNAFVLSLCSLIGHHLEKELRGNKLFNGLIVSPAVNESDDSKVNKYTRLNSETAIIFYFL